MVCPRYIVNQWEGVAWRYNCDSLGKYISVENVNIDEFNTLQVGKVIIFGEEYYSDDD